MNKLSESKSNNQINEKLNPTFKSSNNRISKNETKNLIDKLEVLKFKLERNKTKSPDKSKQYDKEEISTKSPVSSPRKIKKNSKFNKSNDKSIKNDNHLYQSVNYSSSKNNSNNTLLSKIDQSKKNFNQNTLNKNDNRNFTKSPEPNIKQNAMLINSIEKVDSVSRDLQKLNDEFINNV